MPFTIERNGRRTERQLGGSRLFSEILTDEEWAEWQAGRTVAVNSHGGLLCASSVLAPGEVVTLRAPSREGGMFNFAPS